MASSLPTPLAAAIGIVPAVLSGVRSLPGRAVQLPVLAISNALNGVDALRKEYDDLADRGERLVARLRGETVERADDLEDRVEDLVGRTPFAAAYDKVEDTLEDLADATLRPPAAFASAAASAAASATEQVVADVAPIAGRVRRAAGVAADTAAATAADTAGRAAGAATSAAEVVERGAEAIADPVERAVETAVAPPPADSDDTATDGDDTATDDTATDGDDTATDATPAAEAPKGAPTPKAVEPDSSRVDTAASASVVETVQRATAGASTTAVDHDELPLPDYDHMTLGSLRGRLRALSVDQLVQIRTYEKAHADRLPVVTMLDNRIAKLATDASAAPSGPVSTSPAPEQLAAATGPAGALSPATTDAPPINPPSQGDPTNPAQPRR
ncbi:MAG TPA: hypothetical protein VFR07_09895 [Mycobacteriales bacterium]|jgi:hypothetical protein|nr:hypothetical protein [Mycobacteriales bacterium]